MKSEFKGKYFLTLILIISIGKEDSLSNFNYPSAINLSNGNIFIVEKEGIYVYDAALKNKIYSYTFRDEDDKINDVDDLSKVVIKASGMYILCLINSKIFIFDYEGKYLSETGKLIEDQNILHPTLTIIPSAGNDYCYYIIGYFIKVDESYNIKFLYYKLNNNNRENTNIFNFIVDRDDYDSWASEDYPMKGMMGLSCEYLFEEDEGEDAYLVYFYIIQKGDTFSLTQNFLKVTNKLEVDTEYDAVSFNEINEVKQIKSVVNSEGDIALVCCLFIDSTISCYKYRFVNFWVSDAGEFYNEKSFDFNCQNVLYGMKLNYSPIGGNIYLSCISGISTVKAKFFDKDLNLINSDTYEQFTQCSSIYGYSIVHNSVYYIISDVICDNYKRTYELLDGELSPIVIIPTTQKEEYSVEKEEEKEKEKEEESKEEEKKEELIEEKKEEEMTKEIEEGIEEKIKENKNIEEKEEEKKKKKKKKKKRKN